METRQLGSLWPVSALTLGGGGIGQLWGETTREECIATVRAAVDGGITLLDLAPSYGDGEAESVIGAAFEGSLPDGVRITTKCRLGTPPPADVEANVLRSLEESLARLRLERVDLLFLHSNIVPDDYDTSAYPGPRATRWAIYAGPWRDVCEKLIAEGRIGAWGITGIGYPASILEAAATAPRPMAAQCLANPLDSAGELKYYAVPTRARHIIAESHAQRVGVMGIRVVQGGAFCDTVDRPLPADHGVMADYARLAGFRELAAELGTSAAALAHRYALSMTGVDTVVLGVKNRAELADCLAAAEAGALDAATLRRIDAACGAVAS
ncbi:MAG: aldo/keto reductase [Alphaproteobacteria bacterium]|jgi:aryl-alcohol dehydrogenase-like predicted oxidoreductase|nr:aldo/keto reductase [Alphaproteobacteria bacterium]